MNKIEILNEQNRKTDNSMPLHLAIFKVPAYDYWVSLSLNTEHTNC